MTATGQAFVAKVDALVREMQREGWQPAPPESAEWSLQARVDRAVSDYIGEVARNGKHRADGGDYSTDPYTLLFVRAAMTRRERLSPIRIMVESRPFRPTFEAIEDALLKPLVKLAVDREMDADEREARIQLLLADWIPEIAELDAEDEESEESGS